MAARLRLNGRTLDVERGELRDAGGHLIRLRPQALSVLLELGRRPGELVTKRDLMARVWPGMVVTDDSLVQCVVEIRRELGDAGQRVVRTIPRRGYLLVDDSADAPPEGLPPPRQRRHVMVAAAALIALAAFGVLAWQFGAPVISGKHLARDVDGVTVAVLPLRELNAGPGPAAPDGTGLAYLIAGELARSPDLHVLSTLVSAELRTKGMSVQQIGGTTGVRYVVDGSVERRGDRLELELHVIDTKDDRIAWSGRFEPTAAELPGATRLLLEKIAGALGSTMRELRLSASLLQPPASLDAHALALHGIALARRHTAESLRQARRELEQATRLDPGYAPAWAHLGFVRTRLVISRNDPQLGPQDLAQALAESNRAIALDPSLASSWRLLSYAIDASQHPDEAVHAAERAVELGPGDPDNWLALGLAQYYAHRLELALHNVEKAISWHQMRPPEYPLTDARLSYALGDYERALRGARECIESAPAVVVCKAIWLSSQVRTGHTAEAEAAWPRLVAAAPSLAGYRYAPRGSPEAQLIEADLESLRDGAQQAMTR